LTAFRPFLFEFHLARRFREQGMVPTNSDIHPCVVSGAALAHDYIARHYFLTAENFHAQSFAF
jgi:hypothetical protein